MVEDLRPADQCGLASARNKTQTPDVKITLVSCRRKRVAAVARARWAFRVLFSGRVDVLRRSIQMSVLSGGVECTVCHSSQFEFEKLCQTPIF
jgi:hypothetical protein